MKKLVVLLLAASMLLMTACGGATSSSAAASTPPSTPASSQNGAKPAAKDAKDIKIGYICQSMTNQGWLIINDGAQNAAKELGVDFHFTAATQNDSGAWLNAFEDLQNMNCDAIVFGGAAVENVAAIEAAVAKGIICVEVDTPSGAKGTYRIGIRNYDAAVMGAEWMAKAIGNKGTVICVNGNQSNLSGQERRSGFIDTMKKLAPDVKIFEVDSEWVQEKAMNGVEDALTAKNNEVAGVYCAWDGGTVSVASVLKTRGLTGKVKLLGFDGAADALGLMKKGEVDADVGQPLYKMGYEGVSTALKLAQGETIENADIQLGTVVITPDKIDSYIQEAGLTKYVK